MADNLQEALKLATAFVDGICCCGHTIADHDYDDDGCVQLLDVAGDEFCPCTEFRPAPLRVELVEETAEREVVTEPGAAIRCEAVAIPKPIAKAISDSLNAGRKQAKPKRWLWWRVETE